ncbi:uncharacterized protein LOC144362818 [Saccoglossus kowalevskii]
MMAPSNRLFVTKTLSAVITLILAVSHTTQGGRPYNPAFQGSFPVTELPTVDWLSIKAKWVQIDLGNGDWRLDASLTWDVPEGMTDDLEYITRFVAFDRCPRVNNTITLVDQYTQQDGCSGFFPIPYALEYQDISNILLVSIPDVSAPLNLTLDRVVQSREDATKVNYILSWLRPLQHNSNIIGYYIEFIQSGSKYSRSVEENSTYDDLTPFFLANTATMNATYTIKVIPVIRVKYDYYGTTDELVRSSTASITVILIPDTLTISSDVTDDPGVSPIYHPASVYLDDGHNVPITEQAYLPITSQHSEYINETRGVSARFFGSTNAIIIGACAAGGALLISIISIVICVARRSNQLGMLKPYVQSPATDILEDTNYNAKGKSLVPKHEFPLNRLQYVSELGTGHFGVVYKAIASGIAGKDDAIFVAVKKLKDSATSSQKEDMLREIQLLQEIGEHPNIMSVLGCCTSGEPYLLITEYMKYGDLKNFLWRSKKKQFQAEDAIYNLCEMNYFQIGRQIAMGMEFLANQMYVHGDLAARNVLVGDDLLIKITDFGLADDIYLQGWMDLPSDKIRPIHWVSPETNLEGKCTTKSDVWSFGIVLYEIVTRGGRPYPGMTPREVLTSLQNGYRMSKPHDCSSAMYGLMTQCWQENPEERPTFTDLRERLDDLLSQFIDYFNNDSILNPDGNIVAQLDNFENMELSAITANRPHREDSSPEELYFGERSGTFGYLSPGYPDEDDSRGFADRQPYFTTVEQKLPKYMNEVDSDDDNYEGFHPYCDDDVI